MTSYKTFKVGIKVNGTTVNSIIEGMGRYKYRGIEILEKGGIHELKADVEHFYNLQKVLNILKWIEKNIGRETLFNIGSKIPDNALFPKIEIVNDLSIFKSIDIAYHMNHKNADDQILYNPNRPESKKMLEGIGHYEYREFPDDEKRIILKCENPFPCDFDMGILFAFAKKVELSVSIQHTKDSPCRHNGESQYCKYCVKLTGKYR